MTHLTVTPEQLAATTRHTDESGKPYYTVTSATDPDGFYTVRWNSAYKCPQDNCRAGREGNGCWHKRTALAAEKLYQDLQAARRIEATPQYRYEQAEQALVMAERNLAQERNATTQCADGSWW